MRPDVVITQSLTAAETITRLRETGVNGQCPTRNGNGELVFWFRETRAFVGRGLDSARKGEILREYARRCADAPWRTRRLTFGLLRRVFPWRFSYLAILQRRDPAIYRGDPVRQLLAIPAQDAIAILRRTDSELALTIEVAHYRADRFARFVAAKRAARKPMRSPNAQEAPRVR